MVDECRFCAERRSTAIVRDDVILAHTDCKEMDMPYQSVFSKKSHLFLTNLLQNSEPTRRTSVFFVE